MNDPRVSYEQHYRFLTMVAAGAGEELAGFLDAKDLERPAMPEHPRYVQGFNDGKAKLMQEKAVA